MRRTLVWMAAAAAGLMLAPRPAGAQDDADDAPKTMGAWKSAAAAKLDTLGGAFRDCQVAAVKDGFDRGGRIELQWAVDRRGRILGAAVISSSLDHEGLEKCVLGHVRGLSFHPPPTTSDLVPMRRAWKFEAPKTEDEDEESEGADPGGASASESGTAPPPAAPPEED